MAYSVSRAVVEAFYDPYARQDTAGLAGMFHDDIVWTISGPVDVLNWCGVRRGKEAVVDLVDRVIPGLFTVVSLTQSSMLIDGADVATLNRLTVRRRTDDRVISYRLAHFLRFEDDKLRSNLSLIDSFDAVEQMLGHPLAVHDAGYAASDSDLFVV
jgi:ketosteroid isomerase-like protein